MKSTDIIQKFIGSSYVLDRVAREVFERVPLRLRYRLYYGKTFLYWSAFLRESEYWDKDKLGAFQIEQLKALLNHAAKNVPYYKKLFVDYGFKPGKVQCLDDIKTLPYLTKETVRDRVNDFVATTVPKVQSYVRIEFHRSFWIPSSCSLSELESPFNSMILL